MDRRPQKRARSEDVNDEDQSILKRGHVYGDVYINGSGPVHLGDIYGPAQPGSTQNQLDYDADKYQTLSTSLRFDRIDDRMNSVRKALSRTCEWLFQNNVFEEWHAARGMNDHNGFLWIKGKPGCGKSTIMKTALERARKEVQGQGPKQTVHHYFFNARAPGSLEKSSLGFYRSLVLQLLSSYPSIRPLFTEKFSLKEPGESGSAWTKEELQDFLSDVVMLAEPSSLCIFIDALDEGEHEDDVRQMISFLVDLSERALEPSSSCQLRICLSSRHYPHISIRKGLSLVVEDQIEHSKDIDMYINAKLFTTDGADKEDLTVEIQRKSANIFLWVVLVVEILNKSNDYGSSTKDMRKQLDNIPGDLDKLFRETLLKNDHDIEATITLFQWVLFAERPLKPLELYLAIEHSRLASDSARSPASDLTQHATSTVQPLPSDRLSKYITNCSRGLVELTPTHPPLAQFIHETVREFLTGKSGLASLSPALLTNLTGYSHEVLKTGCHRYILGNAIPGYLERHITNGYASTSSLASMKKRIRRYVPFMDYAVSHMLSHAEHAENSGISEGSFLSSMVDGVGRWLDKEKQWWNVFQRLKPRKYGTDVTLLYVLADQQLRCLLSRLLESSVDVNFACGRYGNALQAACASGNEHIVLKLLENGADVNTRGGEYGHALVTAMTTENHALIPVLQRYGAFISPTDANSLLFTNTARRSVENVQAALQMGADVNGVNVKGKSALFIAWVNRHESMLDLLLQNGANINEQLLPHGTMLHEASLSSKTWVSWLLDRGADVNTHIENYGTALNVASYYGKRDIVQLLLDGGADANARGGQRETALQTACHAGSKEMVQMLLDRGADVNMLGGLYGTALQAAACHTAGEEMVQLLLDRGADINASAGLYHTAMEAAVLHGHLGVVQVLKEHMNKMRRLR